MTKSRNLRAKNGSSTYNVFSRTIGTTLDLQRQVDQLRHWCAVMQGARIAQNIDDMERAATEVTHIMAQMTLSTGVIVAGIVRARAES